MLLNKGVNMKIHLGGFLSKFTKLLALFWFDYLQKKHFVPCHRFHFLDIDDSIFFGFRCLNFVQNVYHSRNFNNHFNIFVKIFYLHF